MHRAALPELADLPRPIMLSVGRIASEKNLDAFVELDRPGTKVVVGDGPTFEAMKARYPQAVFLGARFGEELARCYASADVFVFPSRTDTFGLVMIEALASGVPVAGYPVAGPLDIVGSSGLGPDNSLPDPVGAVSENLSAAIDAALGCNCKVAADYGRSFDWDRCTDQFVNALETACSVPPTIADLIDLS
jgi:glycosyltransferase involved in cell wall biosynthesis